MTVGYGDASSSLLIENGVLVGCKQDVGWVTVPEGVLEIGDAAFFGRKNITGVTLPESLVRIGAGAFAYCLGLETLRIPKSVQSIGVRAFSNCRGLRELVLPTALTVLSDGVLEDCASLSALTLPETLTEIGRFACFGCRSLTSLSIPRGVLSIGEAAFGDCAALESLVLPEGLEVISSRTLAGCRTLRTVSLPHTLQKIGNGAFSACAALVSLSLPDGVSEVGNGAFAYCTALTEVRFPRSVLTLGEDCLEGLAPTVRVHMEDARLLRQLSAPSRLLAVRSFLAAYGAQKADEETCAIYGELVKGQKKSLSRALGESLPFYRFLTDRRLLSPAEVRALLETEISVEIKAMLLDYQSRELTPEALRRLEREEERRFERLLSGKGRTVGDWRLQFRWCVLQDGSIFIKRYVGEDAVVTVPARIGRREVRVIGDGAFSHCTHVTDVIVEEGVRDVRTGAFEGCTALLQLALPASIRYVGEGILDGCARPTVRVVAGSCAAEKIKEYEGSVTVKEE